MKRDLDNIPHGTGHDRLSEVRSRMRPVAGLEYGQSPWDTLDRDDMLFLLHSYHHVVENALSGISTVSPWEMTWRLKEARVSLRAAEDYVYSGFPGINALDQHSSIGKPEVEGSDAGQTEDEVFWRATMRPVNGLLAFDVPWTTWWLCEGCGTCAGLHPAVEPTPGFGFGKDCPEGCSFKRMTWEDWRAFGRKKEKA